jgi:hypothetical protein
MKSLRTITILALSFMLLFSTTSCVVLVREDNGLHKGWFKSPNNPHNHQKAHFINQGKSKGKSEK